MTVHYRVSYSGGETSLQEFVQSINSEDIPAIRYLDSGLIWPEVWKRFEEEIFPYLPQAELTEPEFFHKAGYSEEMSAYYNQTY
jgi:hypothetical protein